MKKYCVEKADLLNENHDQDCHVLTASSITDIAFICNVSYSQVLNHINHCRSSHDIEKHLQQFIFRHRPDIQA